MTALTTWCDECGAQCDLATCEVVLSLVFCQVCAGSSS